MARCCAKAERNVCEHPASARTGRSQLTQHQVSVQIIKDLKVKGSSVTLKRGTIVKNIRLSDDEDVIECNADKVNGLVLKTCFLKKV
jgi:protein PhnA